MLSREAIKRWTRILGFPSVCLVLGFALGVVAHKAYSKPEGRFTPNATESGLALDSKTGQYCVANPRGTYQHFIKEVPYCIDLYREF